MKSRAADRFWCYVAVGDPLANDRILHCRVFKVGFTDAIAQRGAFARGIEERLSELRGSEGGPMPQTPVAATGFGQSGLATAASQFAVLATGPTPATDVVATGIIEAAPASDAAPGPAIGAFWARGLDGWGNAATTSSGVGYKQRSGGLLAGVDRDFGVAQGGLSFGFGSSWLDSKNDTDTGQSNSYQGSLYGTTSIGQVFFDGVLGYTHDDYNTYRVISVGPLVRQATGAPVGNDVTLAVRGGMQLVWDDYRFEPSAGFDWYNINRSSFSETGAGSAGLSVNGATANALSPSLGARFTTSYPLADAFIVTPKIEARWYDNVGDRTAPVAAGLIGAPGALFSVTVATPGRESGVISAGLTANQGRSVQFFLGYEAQLAAHFNEQTVSGGIRLIW